MKSSKKSRTAQTRIAFTPLPSSSPAAKDYHQQIRDRAAAVRYESATPSPAKRRRVQFSSPGDEVKSSNANLPTPDTSIQAASSSSSQGLRQSRTRARQQRLDLALLHGTNHSGDGSQQAESTQDHMTPNEVLSDDSDAVPVRSAKKHRTGAGGFMSSASTIRTRGQTRLDLEVVVDSHPTTSATTVCTQIDSGSSSSNDEDDMPTTLGTRKRGSQRSHTEAQPPSSPAFDTPSDEDFDIIHVGTRKRQTEKPDESDDDVLSTTPRRRKLQRSKVISQQDRSDLAEDLEFLEPESGTDTPRQPRGNQSARKTARMKALDALKRKRAGQPVTTEPDQDSEDDDLPIGVPDEQYISSDAEHDPIPTSSKTMFQPDAEDEDFLVEDDEGTLDAPENLPLEFSKFASMKGKELFRYAVEWMVQKKINPAFNITDGLYDLTFKKLNDEVSGLVSSKFSSSAWTADFTTSLRARPGIAVHHTVERLNGEDFLSTHCDACNRSNHPATLAIQFQGKPYHLETLDTVEMKDDMDDDEEDSDSSTEQEVDDKPSYDAQGRKVPPASKIYNVGRNCGANAETAHELSHWKLSLYEWVVKWIVDNGYNTPAKLVERDRWSTKKRRKYANKIADRMAEQGVTKKLWKEFQDSINRARESKQGRF